MRTRLSLLAATALVAAVAYLVLKDALPWQGAAAIKAVPVLALATAVSCFPLGSWSRWVTVGLVLSAVGDLALAVPGDSTFLLGLGAFGVAHVLYTIAFVAADGAPRWARAAPFVVWAVVACLVLAPRTGAFTAPVLLYVLLICTMMWRAAARVSPEAGRAGWLACGGAVVFGVSDTSLATELFVTPYQGSHLLVMVTYWVGQLGIAASAARLEE